MPPAWAPEQVERLLAIDGVAGMWTFAASALRPDRFDDSGYSMTVCYLDGDPVEVADRLPTCSPIAGRTHRSPRSSPHRS